MYGLKRLVDNYPDEIEFRRACPELVEGGRLNLAQDASPGLDSRDEKSRRDDWKLPDVSRYSAIGEF